MLKADVKTRQFPLQGFVRAEVRVNQATGREAGLIQ